MEYSNNYVKYRVIVIFIAVLLFGCSESDIIDSQKRNTQDKASTNNAYFKKSLKLMSIIESTTDKLLPLAIKMPPAKNGEWRAYWNEPEQSPQKYVLSMPSIVTDKLTTLYVKPIGDFSDSDYEIFLKTVEFLEVNFQTPVVALEKSNSNFPAKAIRNNSRGDEQYSSVYITDVMLKEEMPEDAWGILAITPNDIYRAEGINKLYGDSLRYGRRGVISMYHLKNGGRTSLSLTLKGASHEATHLLSLPHCSKYRCNMNGRITLEEFEIAPLYYSPDCLSKIVFATGADVSKRFAELIDFARDNGLKDELDYYTRAYNIIKNK